MHLPIKTTLSSRAKVGAVCGVAVIGLTAVALFSGIPASATARHLFTVVPASEGTFPAMDLKADKTGTWDLFLKTKDKSTIGVDLLTIESGGYSGWHSHGGGTLVTVVEGIVDVIDGDDCTTKTYYPHEGFFENSRNHIHNVKNPYSTTARLVGIQIRPLNSPGGFSAPTGPANCP